MTTARNLAVALGAVAIGLIALLVWQPSPQPAASPPISTEARERGVPKLDAQPLGTNAIGIDPSRVRVAQSLPDGISILPESYELIAELNQPNEAPEHDVEIVENLITTYRGIFGTNPPGGLNSEIVAAMLGANPRKLAIIPPDLASLNSAGELVDRWGTPFLFHPVSGEIMEVLSAGPDLILWTSDDVGKITPANEQSPQEL